MRLIAGILISCGAAFAVAQNSGKSQEPITITFGNEISEKPRLFTQVEALKKRHDHDSDEYTAHYAAMMKQLKVVGVGNLSDSEISLISSVDRPAEDAVKRYVHAKDRAAQASTSKTIEVEQWIEGRRTERKQEEFAEALAAKERREKEEAQQQEQERNRIEEKKADAMMRQARALESYSRRYW